MPLASIAKLQRGLHMMGLTCSVPKAGFYTRVSCLQEDLPYEGNLLFRVLLRLFPPIHNPSQGHRWPPVRSDAQVTCESAGG